MSKRKTKAKLYKINSEELERRLAPYIGMSCLEELKLKEAIYNEDIEYFFTEYCKLELDMPLRLDLFY